jgi:hypothetical protein
MPADYFGHPTKAWTPDATGTNPSMATPTDAVIRPELPSTFVLTGGTAAGQAADKLFESFLRSARLSGGAPKRMKKEEKERAKMLFKDRLNKLFNEVRKVASKTKILKVLQLKRATKKV